MNAATCLLDEVEIAAKLLLLSVMTALPRSTSQKSA
jgi:hypothetical protein